MDAANLVRLQQEHVFQDGRDSCEVRIDALRRLANAVGDHQDALLAALAADLGKAPVEAFLSEIQSARGECRHAIRHLKSWMKPQRRGGPALAWPSRARLHRDPCGSVLVIGPWNYPVHLTLTPLAGVLAAGCSAVIKPSERAPNVSRAIRDLVTNAFSPEEVAVVEGDGAVSESLLNEPFNHVFFTGSKETGVKVMQVAARLPVPVTLELGGKCPVFVFPGAGRFRDKLRRDLRVVARRIAWGKYLNAGQTCVAPDQVFVDREFHRPLLEELAGVFREFGADDHGKMVDRAHFERVRRFMEDGTIHSGGAADPATLKIEPTVLSDVKEDSPITREEIFGPVLPVIACDTVADAVSRSSSEPLAAYVFTHDDEVVHEVAAKVRTGGMCANDVLLHVTGVDLPFGGVGASGLGRYRGKASFDAFTRERVVLSRRLFPDFAWRYPPMRQTLEKIQSLPSIFTGG